MQLIHDGQVLQNFLPSRLGQGGVQILDTLKQRQVALRLLQHTTTKDREPHQNLVAFQCRNALQLTQKRLRISQGFCDCRYLTTKRMGNFTSLSIYLLQRRLPCTQGVLNSIQIEDLQVPIAYAVPRVVLQSSIVIQLTRYCLVDLAKGLYLILITALRCGIVVASIVARRMKPFRIDPDRIAIAGCRHEDLMQRLPGVLPGPVDLFRMVLERRFELFVARDIHINIIRLAVAPVFLQAITNFIQHLALL